MLDVGGYDPLENHVLAKLLALPLLRDVVNNTECACPSPTVCPRRRAWEVLDLEEVRGRVNQLLRVVNLDGQPLLFRDIWDFVADIALGGDCAGDVPSSCWFWRVLYGNSAISVRLRRHADPAAAVFPRAEARLWHEDLLSEEIELLEGVELLPSPAGEAMTLSRFNWLKSQLFFLARYDSMLQMVRDQVDLELTIALDAGRMQDLIGAMNRYMTYGTLPVPTQLLFLWTDMGFERRAERARGQVSLGSVETDRFEVRRSFAVANHPDGELVFHGREAVLSSRDVGRHAGAHS